MSLFLGMACRSGNPPTLVFQPGLARRAAPFQGGGVMERVLVEPPGLQALRARLRSCYPWAENILQPRLRSTKCLWIAASCALLQPL